jgi:hypothetical protein
VWSDERFLCAHVMEAFSLERQHL